MRFDGVLLSSPFILTTKFYRVTKSKGFRRSEINSAAKEVEYCYRGQALRSRNHFLPAR